MSAPSSHTSDDDLFVKNQENHKLRMFLYNQSNLFHGDFFDNNVKLLPNFLVSEYNRDHI